jgi:chromosome segregation ATPase
MNYHIEKYKNEAYAYKCERDELKQLLNNLKARKEAKEKEMEKLTNKCKTYKEKVTELETLLNLSDIEKKETENKFIQENSELKSKLMKVVSQMDELKTNYNIIQEDMENHKKKIEDFKIKCENLSSQNKELTERNIKLMRYGRKNHMSNFSSQ